MRNPGGNSMTRGKHGAAAAVRHEVQTAAQQIETYKNAVARLTAENANLKASINVERERARRTEKELRVRLDQAAAPQIEALHHELAAARGRVLDSKRELVKQIELAQQLVATFRGVLFKVEGLGAEVIDRS